MHKQRLIIIVLLLIPLSVSGSETLIFSTIQGSIHTLVSVEVIKEAYRRIGITATVEEYPGKRALFYANTGRTDGELFRIAGIEGEYPNLIPVPVPINRVEGMACVRNANLEVSGWQSLKAYRVGVRRGIKFSEKGTQGMNPKVVNSNKELLTALSNDIVDLAVISRLNALDTTAKLASKDIRCLEPPIESYLLFHYLHKSNRHLVPKLTKTLEVMEREGFIGRVRARHITDLKAQARGALD